MSVFRINKTKDYTVMSNTHLKDKNLSLKAKGLLSVMLSLPDDWDYSINGLCSYCNAGKDVVTNALKELKEFKYLHVEKINNAVGTYEYIYNIYEIPTDEPCAIKPCMVEPCMEKPCMENPPQQNNNYININNNTVTNKQSTKVQKKSKESLKEEQMNNFKELAKERDFSPKMLEKIYEWLSYKEELNDMYKTVRGFKQWLTELENNILKYGEQNIAWVIDVCISREYKGVIYELADKKQKENSNYSPIKPTQTINKKYKDLNNYCKGINK